MFCCCGNADVCCGSACESWHCWPFSIPWPRSRSLTAPITRGACEKRSGQAVRLRPEPSRSSRPAEDGRDGIQVMNLPVADQRSGHISADVIGAVRCVVEQSAEESEGFVFG